jgi:tetrapyrrole methylase family protein/MazG family protein
MSVEEKFKQLYQIIKKLRSPSGCAWDRKQTPDTLRTTLLEETFECISAIQSNNDNDLKEELGDLFLNLTLISYMKEEEGSFSLSGVLQNICDKLIRRHPHVFDQNNQIDKSDVSAIINQWDKIKHDEGKYSGESILDSLPKHLPPLEQAYRIQKKVSKVGFDWDKVDAIWDKLKEEELELKHASIKGGGNKRQEEMENEAGDVLFTVINLCRKMNIDPSLALHKTNKKFIKRFKELEKRMIKKNKSFDDMTLEMMDEIWNEIKTNINFK